MSPMKWNFDLGHKDVSKYIKSINVIQHIDRIKDKKIILLSQQMQKSLQQNTISFSDKSPQHIGYRRNIPQHKKGHYNEPTANIIFTGEIVIFLKCQDQNKGVHSHHSYLASTGSPS